MIERARGLSTAALIIHSHDDLEVPFVDAERLSAAWSHSRLLEVHGLGHRTILRDASIIAAAVRHMTE